MRAYHGASSAHLAAIERDGLRRPCLARTPELASYYADVAAETDGGTPVLLAVEVDPALLRYDPAAMDEPVSGNLPCGIWNTWADDVADRRDAAWSAWDDEHPGQAIPDTAWRISWEAVGSARTAGDIEPAAITRADDELVLTSCRFRDRYDGSRASECAC